MFIVMYQYTKVKNLLNLILNMIAVASASKNKIMPVVICMCQQITSDIPFMGQ